MLDAPRRMPMTLRAWHREDRPAGSGSACEKRFPAPDAAPCQYRERQPSRVLLLGRGMTPP